MSINKSRPVTLGTRENLIRGVRSRPMTPEAINAALSQAVRLAELLAGVYASEIAAGEVGASGTGVASEEPILATRAPTALIYGRVQSGKTAAMILTAALCLDNGFRIIVVLTANNVALVQQTANRFKSLNGPRVFSSVKEEIYDWEGQEDELREEVASDGLVLICAKDAFHLPQIIQFLQRIDASSYPALVFDDEADAATPDTTLAARTAGRAAAPAFPSTIHRRVIENPMPGQEGESIGELLPHGLYVQVTATPYLLFLQRRASRVRPNVTFLLEPGAGYCGGEVFFGAFDPNATTPAEPPLVLVSSNEAQAINRRSVPTGLASSIDFFLLASATIAYSSQGKWPAEGFKHLSHTSHRTNQHLVVVGHIERHIGQIRRQLREDPAAAASAFSAAHIEFRRTAPTAPDISQLMPIVSAAVRQAEFIRVNSETDIPRYGPQLNFVVGGNILGRGLTIDDLLVTYYVREAQVSQMDTVWQHARMYRYRAALMPYTRVYLPRRVAARFKDIHESEDELRSLLQRAAAGEEVPVKIARGTRATRPNATELETLEIYRAGMAQIFPWFVTVDANSALAILALLQAAGVPVAVRERDARCTRVPLQALLDFVDRIPIIKDDPGHWKAGAITSVVESFQERYAGEATIYVRGLNEPPPVEGWPRGRLSGAEIDLIRQASPGLPALALLYLGGATAPSGWYPTLVLPPNTSTYIFNPSTRFLPRHAGELSTEMDRKRRRQTIFGRRNSHCHIVNTCQPIALNARFFARSRAV